MTLWRIDMSDLDKSGINIECIVVGRIRTNCYIISNKENNEAVIVDPGADKDLIINSVKRQKLKPAAILLTHGHFDHIMSAADISAEFGIKIYAGEHEDKLLQDPYMNCSVSMGNAYRLRADIWLKDNQNIEPGGMGIKVIYTPGHTIGGVCYYFYNNGIILSGDTLFMNSIGRTDLPTGNINMLIDSIKNKLFMLNNDIIVMPGHGEKTTIGYEKENNIYIDEEGLR